MRNKKLPTKLKRRISIYTLILMLTIFIVSVGHIELLWFSQFDWQGVIIRRSLIQFICIVGGYIFARSLYKLQESFLITIRSNSKGENIRYIKGNQYSLTLITTLFGITITLYLLYYFALLSINDPFKVAHKIIDFDNYHFNSKVFIFTLISLFTIFFSKRNVKRIQNLITFLFCIFMARCWGLWSLAFSIPNSNLKDDLFNMDISYSIARYPAIFTFGLVVLNLVLFIIFNSIWLFISSHTRISEWSTPRLTNIEKSKLKPLVSLALLLTGMLIWISRHQSMWNSNGIVPGAGWLDIHFSIPLRAFASICLFIVSVLLLIDFKSKARSGYFFIASFVPLIILTTEVILTPIIQWIIVKPRELIFEKEYITRSIKSTRKAFKLDSIQSELINPNNKISGNDLEMARSTVNNIRLWDSRPLLATNRQLQQFRAYYTFKDASADRYILDNDKSERQQVIISARQLDYKKLTKNSNTWLNKHFIFTHGYGFTVSPVNTKANDGLPDYFISDLGKSTKIIGNREIGINSSQVKDNIPLGEAGIYYGTVRSPYSIAPSKLEEIDYPEGNKNIFNKYSGNGGILLNNIWNRISASIYLREPRLLTTNAITLNSRLLIHREVTERIKRIAPFLVFLDEPYLISSQIEDDLNYSKDHNLYWVVEAYTTSRTYPYSDKNNRRNEIRYIRNSVKAIVNCYNGNINLYITDTNDPIIKGWNNLFPYLFKPLESMPINLRNHIKVPTEMFKIQVDQLLRYHVTDAKTFYNGDDIWEIPKELYGKRQILIEPYHITSQLPNNTTAEFLLLQPFSPISRPNLAAWLAARNDGDNYGKLVLLRFPSQINVFGPEQIQALINQNPEISQQFSLWDRAGSEVIQGNLIVIPVGKALLYIEPVYLKASQGGLPTLTRVVVSDGKRVTMAADLMEALEELMNKSDSLE